MEGDKWGNREFRGIEEGMMGRNDEVNDEEKDVRLP